MVCFSQTQKLHYNVKNSKIKIAIAGGGGARLAYRREYPEALSGLVLKLPQKSPEGRYQSAAGVAADLRRIQERSSDQGAEKKPFEFSQDDMSERFETAKGLYVRENEIGHMFEVQCCQAQKLQYIGQDSNFYLARSFRNDVLVAIRGGCHNEQ